MSSNGMEEPLPLIRDPWGSSQSIGSTSTEDDKTSTFSSRSPFLTEEQKDIEYFYTWANVIVEIGSGSLDLLNLQSENLQLKQKIEQMTIQKNALEDKTRSLEKEKTDIIQQSIEFVKDKRIEYAEQARNYVAKIMVDRDKQKDELLKLQQKSQEADTKLQKKKNKVKELKNQLESLQKIQSTITQHGFQDSTTTPDSSLPQTPNPTPRLSTIQERSSSDSDNNTTSSTTRYRLSEKIPMDSPTMYQYQLLQERIKFYEEKFQEYTNIMVATKTSLDQMKIANLKFTSFIESFDKFGDPIHLATFVYKNISSVALLEMATSKNGHLIKQGQKVKNWKQRFFILKDNFLFYYSPQKGVEPLGVVMLLNQTVEEVPKSAFGKEFCFKLTSLGKDYFYCASSENERQQWIEAFKHAKKWWEDWN
mmetsp:Transcript_26932/g.37948  ORF Transcript_26932/g.37948 Transcript_26932/m.37948 type:complete len:421 (-) Transcript_26932:100-1362(-)